MSWVLSTTFASNKPDAIIYPEQKNLVVKIGSPAQAGLNGILAVLTGFPVVTVPAGFSPPTSDAPIGVPIGMEIMGLPWSESKLLNTTAHISNLTHVKRMPTFGNNSVEVSVYLQLRSKSHTKYNYMKRISCWRAAVFQIRAFSESKRGVPMANIPKGIEYLGI